MIQIRVSICRAQPTIADLEISTTLIPPSFALQEHYHHSSVDEGLLRKKKLNMITQRGWFHKIIIGLSINTSCCGTPYQLMDDLEVSFN